MSRFALAWALLLALAPLARAADPDPGFLRADAETRGFRLGRPVNPRPTPDGKSVLFLRAEARSPAQSLYQFDVATGRTRLVLSPAELLKGATEELSPAERARRERMRVTTRGFTSFDLSDNGALILVTLSGRLYTVRRSDGKTVASPPGDSIVDPHFSPDGKRIAYVRGRDLYVLTLVSGREKRLTHSADPRITCGLAEFVAEEEMARFTGMWWSPDSRALAFEEADTRPVETFHLVDLTKPTHDAEARPYPRAGTANAKVRLGVVSVDGGAPVWIKWDADRLPYLTRVVWKDRAPLTLLVEDRRQHDLELLTADEKSGVTTRLVAEHDTAWVNLDASVPRWLPDGSAFLWSSESSGTWQLELRDRKGARLRSFGGPERYERLIDVDPKERAAYFEGAPDPTTSELFRVPLDGGPAVALTRGPAVNRAAFGRDHHLYALTTTTAQSLPVTTVHRVVRGEDRALGTLPSVAEEPPFRPSIEYVRIAPKNFPDGFECAITRPRHFDPKRKYPVVVDVYGGPHHQQVTRAEAPALLRQWIADHGFVVVAVDGRGTPNRGRAWERAIRGKLGAVPLADQVSALQALGARYPELDLSRVGIYGWSFGGYLSALAVLRRPDIFRVAVAGAPVVDWHDYDTFYTERYLGLPDEDPNAYDQSSLLSYAKYLARPLLLIHGTRDDNVYFFQTLELCDALFRAGKRFDFLPLTGFTHLVPDPVVKEALYGRIVDQLTSALHPQDR